MPALNGELIVFVLVWVVVFIITLAADSVDWPGFVTASVVLAGAYMISRGIAKAGKVSGRPLASGRVPSRCSRRAERA